MGTSAAIAYTDADGYLVASIVGGGHPTEMGQLLPYWNTQAKAEALIAEGELRYVPRPGDDISKLARKNIDTEPRKSHRPIGLGKYESSLRDVFPHADYYYVYDQDLGRWRSADMLLAQLSSGIQKKNEKEGFDGLLAVLGGGLGV